MLYKEQLCLHLSSYYFLVIVQHADQYNGVQLCLKFVFVLNLWTCTEQYMPPRI